MLRLAYYNVTIGANMYNKRQEAILDFIKDNPDSKREKIELYLANAGFEVTKMTVTRDLKLLIENGDMEKTGKAKSTVYRPSARANLLSDINIETYFAEDQDARSRNVIPFNFNIFDSLKKLFDEQEKNRLAILNNQYRNKKGALSTKLLQKEFERLTVELAWKSSKIEGNTYTLLDTERLLNENVAAKGKTAKETNMVLNHKKAIDFILNEPEYYRELSLYKIEEIHKILTDNLDVATGIRTGAVGIVGTNYKPIDNSFQIKESLQKLITVVNETDNPLEKALIIVLMIAYIQPFEDGNKRTSRILANAVLMAHDYCPLSYRSVDEIEYKKAVILFYEKNNASYFKKLFVEQFKQAVEKYF